MTLEERMATIQREEMLLREQHARARTRLSDILDVLDRFTQDDAAGYDNAQEYINEIADLARAGLRET